MFVILDKDNKVVIGDNDRQKLLRTLLFMPQYTEDNVEECDVEPCNGSLYKRGYAPLPTLEEVKADKVKYLSEYVHQFDSQLENPGMIITSSLGFRANADLRSQNNVNGLLTIGVEPVQYRDADNSYHPLQLADLETLRKEFYQNGQNLYVQKWKAEQAIQACETVEEVKCLEISFEMLDFNKE